MQKAAASFCERQHLALDFIKERRKKDSRFETILSDCEKNVLCRRLPLQAILPTEMQRLTKYPMLLERLINCINNLIAKEVQMDLDLEDELSKLKQAYDRSKEILNHVNEAAELASNRARLLDIQRHLDISSFERNDHAIVNDFRVSFHKFHRFI